MRVLEPFFNDFDEQYSALRNHARDILQQDDALAEIVQLVGCESLSEDQKVVMEVAKILREDFLQQNAFTKYDYTCPLVKSVGMLRCIITLYVCCQRAIADSPPEAKITWAHIKTTMGPLIQEVVAGNRVDPKTPTEEIKAHYDDVSGRIEQAFQTLGDI